MIKIRPKPDEGGRERSQTVEGWGGLRKKCVRTYRKVEAGVVQQTHPYALQAG
jgi:hypothetical protein